LECGGLPPLFEGGAKETVSQVTTIIAGVEDKLQRKGDQAKIMRLRFMAAQIRAH
jgi:hypothetical protein